MTTEASGVVLGISCARASIQKKCKRIRKKEKTLIVVCNHLANFIKQ